MNTAALRRSAACLLLALPPVAVKLWVLLAIGYYPAGQFAGDVVAMLAVAVLALLVARWRLAGPASWPLAVLLYAAALCVQLAEAASYYFQAGSFNARFLANLRLANLPAGVAAYPGIAAFAGLLLVATLAGAGWLLRVPAAPARRPGAMLPRWLVVAVPLACVLAVPSAWSRLAALAHGDASLLHGTRGQQVLALLDRDPVPPGSLHATPGKNLVVIYMESLERIYTDDKVFPGLTPNLDRWRERGLDFPGFRSFRGATYTIAGIFASQCGSAYFAAASDVFDLASDDPNDTSFHPELACLGDVLHKAGYHQVFMNGAPLAFANQGAFFRMHGFDEVLGLEQLQRIQGNRLAAPGWGLYDSDLFRLAEQKFSELAAGGRPFQLDLLTIDNHPPGGRPSPGCPKYARNDNDQLQAVHCTDYLVGKFLDAISANPAWKDTVVVVMSDHLSMRNDAWPLYPADYPRRPLLFVLNAGHGTRAMRFFHMDIAPTILHLMGVDTNATFLAGADRSQPGAPGSPLRNDPADVAAVREALWAHASPLQACTGSVLVGSKRDGLLVGGHGVALSMRGAPLVGLSSGQALGILVRPHGLVTLVDSPGRLAELLGERGEASALVVKPRAGAGTQDAFEVSWLGRDGARAKLADVPRLAGLQITAPDCRALLERVDRAPSGTTMDLRGQFHVATAPLYPLLPARLDFTNPGVRRWQRGLGWLPTEASGSWAQGDVATLGFSLPADSCHAARVAATVRPFIAGSRPRLDVRVLANGRQVAGWRFTPANAAPQTLEFPVAAPGPGCHVDLRFEFARPGAGSQPWPAGEDPRPLQLEFTSLQVLSSGSGASPH